MLESRFRAHEVMLTRHTQTADSLERYRTEVVKELVRLGKEYPWWWQKMQLHIDEPAVVGDRSFDNAFRWHTSASLNPARLESDLRWSKGQTSQEFITATS